MEQWVVIEEAPNYLISNLGRVQNRMTGRFLRSRIDGGYPKVTLVCDGRYFSRFIHRLVAIAFVDGFAPDLFVNHIDGNKNNAKADNLEWVTRQQNLEHAMRTGLVRKLKRWVVSDDRKTMIEVE